MAFFTTLKFYRPTKPPLINGARLAVFLRAFDGLGISEWNYPRRAEIKFGIGIDQDQRASQWLKWILPSVAEVHDVEWDIEEEAPSLAVLSDRLTRHTQPIYRASLDLGSPTGDIIQQLQRVNSPENDQDLCLDGWSLSIDRVSVSSLESEQSFFVGWLRVSCSGNGYLYPWTFKDLVGRAESHPGIQRLMALCRETWPVPSRRPDRRELKQRKAMAELWPYPDLDRPLDWYWGVSET